MSDIADEMGISKGSLYNYVCSKEELYLQTISNRFNLFLNLLTDKITDTCDSIENLKTLIIQYYSFMCKYSHFFELWKQLKTHAYSISKNDLLYFENQLKELFYSVLSRGISDGSFKDVDIHFSTEMIFGMLDRAISRGINIPPKDRTSDKQQLVQFVQHIVLVDSLSQQIVQPSDEAGSV
ncbi:MAG: hypothetical protein Kow00108_08530 [Calditrichia bacterium]